MCATCAIFRLYNDIFYVRPIWYRDFGSTLESCPKSDEVMQEAETIDTGDTSTIRNNYDQNKPRRLGGGPARLGVKELYLYSSWLYHHCPAARKKEDK